jgi:hypothetical protein
MSFLTKLNKQSGIDDVAWATRASAKKIVQEFLGSDWVTLALFQHTFKYRRVAGKHGRVGNQETRDDDWFLGYAHPIERGPIKCFLQFVKQSDNENPNKSLGTIQFRGFRDNPGEVLCYIFIFDERRDELVESLRAAFNLGETNLHIQLKIDAPGSKGLFDETYFETNGFDKRGYDVSVYSFERITRSVNAPKWFIASSGADSGGENELQD